MTFRFRSTFSLFSGAVIMTGCTSVTPEQAFRPVQSSVSTLSGYTVAWNQGTADDQRAESEVKRLLDAPLDANTAAQVALLNNPDLQATFEEIGISQADLVQAGLLKNPVFSASFRFPDAAPGFTDAEYSLAQDFLSVLVLPLQVKVAKGNLAATQDRVTHEVLHLIAEVKTEFYTYQSELQLDQRLKLIGDADQAAVDVAKAQHDSGNLNDMGYVNQQTQLTSAHLAFSDAQKEEIHTRENLNRLMGLWSDETTWTARRQLPELPGHDPSLEHLEIVALGQRRDLLELREETDSLGPMLALKTNTRYLPGGINLGVDTEKISPDQRVTGPTLDLELPLFDQGQGQIAKLAAQYRQLERRRQALTVLIRSEVKEARDTLKIDRDEVTYFRKVAVPLNLHSVNQSLLQYNAMEVNTYELFLAKQRELDTERDYIGTWRDYWISRTRLEEAVGGNLDH